jgi:hypothetical protein
LAHFNDVRVDQAYRTICYCEEFELDEKARRLQFRNVTKQQNLWELLPKEGNILVWVMDSDGKEGRLHIQGITPDQDDPAEQKPDHWHGTLQRVGAYGEGTKSLLSDP